MICFSVQSPINKPALVQLLTTHFGYHLFKWIDDITEIANDDYVYIEQLIVADGFKYHYTIYCKEHPSPRQVVTLLQPFALQEKIAMLCSDDEISPYSAVLIEPDGETATVQVADNVVEGYYNFLFGSFRTYTVLSQEEQNILRDIIKPVYPSFNILVDDYNYSIQPIGKNKWLDRNEKSDLFIQLMKTFQPFLQQEICIFPANFCEVKNIPGGSDSEEYYILLLFSDAVPRLYHRNILYPHSLLSPSP